MLLIRYTSDIERVAELIKQAAALSIELRSIEREIADSRAPTEEHLDELRAERRESQQLRADLDAGRLRVKATSIADMTLDVTVDDADSEVKRLQPGYSHEWQARQKARFEISSLGVVEVSRGAGGSRSREDQSSHQGSRRRVCPGHSELWNRSRCGKCSRPAA